jgi:hypothetical protein
MVIVKDECYYFNFRKNSLAKTLRPTVVCEEGFLRWFAAGVFRFHISPFC